jgi:hypothetical protein
VRLARRSAVFARDGIGLGWVRICIVGWTLIRSVVREIEAGQREAMNEVWGF